MLHGFSACGMMKKRFVSEEGHITDYIVFKAAQDIAKLYRNILIQEAASLEIPEKFVHSFPHLGSGEMACAEGVILESFSNQVLFLHTPLGLQQLSCIDYKVLEEEELIKSSCSAFKKLLALLKTEQLNTTFYEGSVGTLYKILQVNELPLPEITILGNNLYNFKGNRLVYVWKKLKTVR